jgi:hypothetical protein
MLVKTGPKKFYGAYSPLGGKAASVAASFAKSVHLNGSTYITSSGGVTTAAGKSYLLSFWFRYPTTPSGYVIWFENSGGVGGFSIQRNATSGFDVYAQDSSSFNVASVTGLPVVNDTNWHHCAVSANAVGPFYEAFLDGVALTPSFGSTSANNINFAAATAVNIGGRGASLFATGDIAELYVAYNQVMTLSTPANLQKFRSVSGHPVDLGVAGATPTGTAPTMYFSIRAPSGVATDFLTNRGTGGSTWTSVPGGGLTLGTIDP